MDTEIKSEDMIAEITVEERILRIDMCFYVYRLLTRHKFQIGSSVFESPSFRSSGNPPNLVFKEGDLVGLYFAWMSGKTKWFEPNEGVFLFEDNKKVEIFGGSFELKDDKGRMVKFQLLQEFNAEEYMLNDFDERRRCQEDRLYNGIHGIFVG